MLTLDERFQEESRRMRPNAAAEQMINLDDHNIEDNEVPPQLGHKSGSETVLLRLETRRRDKRSRIGDEYSTRGYRLTEVMLSPSRDRAAPPRRQHHGESWDHR